MRMASTTRQLKSALERLDWVIFGCIVFVTGMLATLSILRYLAYNAHMFDLGNMTQAIWSSTRGRPLEFSYRDGILSRLALHAELIYFLLTPLYALFPSPVTLLLTQALLFGAAGFPLYCLAKRRTGNVHAARLITLIYLCYPMAHTAVLYDFHGDTLAMPLLLFAFEALDRRAWRAYALWLFLALASKVYVAAPVCLLGAFLWLKGERRAGLLTVMGGALWGVVVYFGIRPLFASPANIYQQSDALGYAQFYFGTLLTELGKTWALRFANGMAVFAPIIPIALFAMDWTGLALAVALPIVLSSGPGPSFYYRGHHYALVVPFVAMIAVHGAARLAARVDNVATETPRQKRSVTWPVALGATGIFTLLLNLQLVNTPLRPVFYTQAVQSGWSDWGYRPTTRDAFKNRWLKKVPDEAPVVTSMMLAPHLTRRYELYIQRPIDDTAPPRREGLLNKADYVVLDGLLDYVELAKGERGVLYSDVTYDWEILTATLHRPDFGLISAQDGLLMFQKRPTSFSDADWAMLTLSQEVTVNSAPATVATQAEFADAIGLVEASIEHVRERRYRLRYVWVARAGVSPNTHWFAVTHLLEADEGRILHVPTIALHPTTMWTPGELITETFEVELAEPIPPGHYTLTVGWYDSGHIFAYATDARSQVGQPASVGTLEVVGMADFERQ